MLGSHIISLGGASLADHIQPFRIEKVNLLGRMVRTETVFTKVLGLRPYPAPVAHLLGEALCLSALLAATLKYEGKFTLQAQGDGPIRMLVVDMGSDGGMRAHIRFDEEAFGRGEMMDGTIARLFGGGHLAFTVDQGPDTERYQGITELSGVSLADCAHAYFRQSEQLQTAIKLGAAVTGGDGTAGRAAGLMIQRLPDDEEEIYRSSEDEENWRKSVILMSSLSDEELLDPALDINTILYRLFHEDGVRVYDPRPLAFSCSCSRQKVIRTLTAFPRDELADMWTEDGNIVATCEFCQSDYVFSDDDLAQSMPA
ncbi:MAG: Hsp33 family molecular chaperone HslO [Rhodospirillales bacterium]|nr:Hsp33 family molecular chaperone HslO [Rhodospirillales bacterium]